jgi:hypothetical protein
MSLSSRHRIRQAAFLLALRLPWHLVTLEAISREANLSLSELRHFAPSKASILCDFSSDIDNSMLLNLARQPPSGEVHDRLFDVVLRRLEIMGPYREVLASILRSPVADPSEGMELFSAANRSVGWMLAAAGAEDDSHWRGMKKIALLRAYWRVLQVWAEDDDPALTMTMAALDRRLRDAQSSVETLGSLIRLARGAGRAAAEFWNRHRQSSDRDT